ncbi:MAG: metallophosphoesterase family protein [Chthoniobacterales bacterium]
MKRVAALYDIHANLPALEAVLDEISGSDVDAIVVGGDVVPGPMPRQTVARLQQLDRPVHFIRGNGELAVLGDLRGVPAHFQERIRWNTEQLTSKQFHWLSQWPLTRRIQIDSHGEVLFCHATARDENELFTARTADDHVLALFAEVHAPLVVCGHTHMQFDRTLGALRIVNAGSVGMPFGTPGAYWLLLGPDVQLRRTSYDLDRAAQRIRASDYPGAEEFATGNVLQPPAADAMLEAFTPATR